MATRPRGVRANFKRMWNSLVSMLLGPGVAGGGGAAGAPYAGTDPRANQQPGKSPGKSPGKGQKNSLQQVIQQAIQQAIRQAQQRAPGRQMRIKVVVKSGPQSKLMQGMRKLLQWMLNRPSPVSKLAAAMGLIDAPKTRTPAPINQQNAPSGPGSQNVPQSPALAAKGPALATPTPPSPPRPLPTPPQAIPPQATRTSRPLPTAPSDKSPGTPQRRLNSNRPYLGSYEFGTNPQRGERAKPFGPRRPEQNRDLSVGPTHAGVVTPRTSPLSRARGRGGPSM